MLATSAPFLRQDDRSRVALSSRCPDQTAPTIRENEAPRPALPGSARIARSVLRDGSCFSHSGPLSSRPLCAAGLLVDVEEMALGQLQSSNARIHRAALAISTPATSLSARLTGTPSRRYPPRMQALAQAQPAPAIPRLANREHRVRGTCRRLAPFRDAAAHQRNYGPTIRKRAPTKLVRPDPIPSQARQGSQDRGHRTGYRMNPPDRHRPHETKCAYLR